MFALIYKVLRQRIFDEDLWWHLASGRMMVENKVFLRQDVFSHTLYGVRWVNFEWLSQILLYLAVKWVGWGAILYGKVVLGLAVVGLVGFVIHRVGARGPAFFLLLLVGFVILRPRLYERIELITLVLLPLFVFFLSELRWCSRRNLKTVPPILFGLMAVWCNMHGGFVYGIGIASLFCIGARWSQQRGEVVEALDRTLVFLLVAMLVNPFGVRITDIFADHLAQLFSGPSVIQEWAPLAVREAPFFWLLFAVGGLALLAGLLQNQPAAKFWGPAVFAFLVWGALFSRNTVTIVFVVLPFLAELFSNWTALHFYIQDRRLRWAGWTVVWGALCYAAPHLLKPSPRGMLQVNRFPIGACRFVETHDIRGTMYNTYHLGGYIEWALGPVRGPAGGPGRKVFMDGRYLFHSLIVEHARLDDALFQKPDSREWQRFLGRFGVDYAIADYGFFTVPSRGKTPFSFSPLNLMFPRSDWALVYWDDAALLFLKRTPTFEPTIRKSEFRALWPYNLEQMRVLFRTNKVARTDIERELERHRREVGFSVVRGQMEDLLKGAGPKTR